MTKAFESWQKALNDARLAPPAEFYGYYYPNWILIELLQDLACDLDKVPERTDLENKPGFPPDIVYECRSDSWENQQLLINHYSYASQAKAFAL